MMIKLHFLKIIKKPRIQIFVITLSLFIQNIVIFREYYAGKMIFLWDFTRTYYAIPAFFTTAISKGIFPQWMPFQAMGYPLLINSQSGLFYPIFWIFPLFGIPYTLYSAVVLQCLHIFFGSLGMFLFLRLFFKSARLGFIGAVAFQFFGGFYSTTEFPDIIRAYSIIPWLFYLLTINFKSNLSFRMLFIPVGVYLFTTSSYPGIFIAGIFIFSVYVSLQILNAYFQKVPKIRLLKISISTLFLIVLGFSMAMVYLGPIWQEKNDVERLSSPSLQYNSLWFTDLHSILLSNRTIPGITVLSSAFITIPIFAFACFVSYTTIKKYWIIFTTLVISTLMVAGQQSFFWNAVTYFLPVLKLSRFPMFDYLEFISIPLIFFGIAGLKIIFENKGSKMRFIYRISFFVASISIALFTLYSNLNIQVITAISISGITIFVIGYFHKKTKDTSNLVKTTTISLFVTLIIISIISIDGYIVISDMPRWNLSTPIHYWTYMIPPEKNGTLTTISMFDHLPKERPARESYYNIFANAYGGYLNGTFMMGDYGGTVLKSRTMIESDDIYRNFMQMKWTTLLLDPSVLGNKSDIELPKSDFKQNEIPSQENIKQIYYGINEITYHISLEKPKIMVENEMYFLGWHAALSSDKQIILQSVPINGLFRGWILPAGEYDMKTFFEFPNFKVFEGITFASVGLWLVFVAYYAKNLKAKKNY